MRSCMVCGCTESDACAGGCRWEGGDVCDTCALLVVELADMITAYLDVAGPSRVRAKVGQLVQSVPPSVAARLLRDRITVALRLAMLTVALNWTEAMSLGAPAGPSPATSGVFERPLVSGPI